jgi:hypothetical protein
MKFAIDTMNTVVRGTARQRIVAAVTVASWFAMGAFVTSVVTYYIDPYVSANLTAHSNTTAVVGGVCASIIACIKSV